MLKDFIGAKCIIFFSIKNGLIVICPSNRACCVWNYILHQLTGLQVFEANGIYPSTDNVFTVSKDLIIWAYTSATDRVVIVCFSFLVGVYHKGYSICSLCFTLVDCIFLAFFITRNIRVAIIIIRYAHIILFDTAFDLIEEFILETIQVVHHLIGVFIF